jgi:hypothetical protein
MAIKSLVLLTHSGSTTARKEVHTTGLVSLAIITDHIYNNTSIYIQNTLVQLSHDVQVNAPLIMHFTSILRTLHWLPIDYLNKFKRAVLIYARTGVSPRSVYIFPSLVSIYLPTISHGTLRFSNCQLLDLPLSKAVFSSRGFRIAGPQI